MANLNELKPEDVMRALECCITQGTACRNCPLLYDKRGARCYAYLKQDALALLREKDAEIERKRERIVDLNCEIERLKTLCAKLDGYVVKARADAITEFAERAKRRLPIVSPSVFDKIAKEMKGN